MIKRLALTMLLALPMLALAQDVEKGGNKTQSVQKPSRDHLMIQFAYSGWIKPDSIKTKGIGRDFNTYLCYDFPIKKSNFSFAAGLGVSASNIYLDHQHLINRDTPVARFAPDTINFKRSKLVTAYIEAPFEFRFYGNKENRNKGFKAAVGMRVGTLVNVHMKGKEDGTKINDKTNAKQYVNQWRFAATLRLGWGNFSVMGTYNITPLFKDKQGPEITPYSIGICLTGL
ncbi:MAG: outer membrane beta-barrel protein [Bacteroidetes bacterium]|nr:outer membrane beta-barrel protein [Bacteroidota bacterium]